MEIIKTLLAGCGALALLSVVGCVGLVGAGSYAVDQAIEEQRARDAAFDARDPKPHEFGEDPFSDYEGRNERNDWESQDNWSGGQR